MSITGNCPVEFSAVQDAFEENFEEGLELGAAFAVFIDGQCLVDIKGGFADKKKTIPWTDNHIASIYSSGKAVVAYLIAKAVAEGFLDYDTPVAHYWPEFSVKGKDHITLAQVLSHQGGLCGFEQAMEPSIWLDWDETCSLIASMEPLWEPGTHNGYHPQTFGYIAGEVYRRAYGKTLSESLRATGLDIYCGLESEEIARTTYMAKPTRAPHLGDITDLKKIAFLKPWSSTGSGTGPVSREQWMTAQIPASNMHGSAKALAQLLHPIANDGRDINGHDILTQSSISGLFQERSHGEDLILPYTLSWAAGVMRNHYGHFGPNKNALGQAGFGGSAVVMDPDRHMSIAYVMNKMSHHLVGDPRYLKLIHAVYGCL